MEKEIKKENISFDRLPEETLVHKLESSGKAPNKKIYFFAVVIVLLGGLSGFLLSKTGGINKTANTPSSLSTSSKSKVAVGSTDTKLYPDSAEGILETNGINGEGTHKLIRPGGDSQTVYLISSSLDLNQFTGKKVKVWGQTFAGKKAGWLMDVGRVEQLE